MQPQQRAAHYWVKGGVPILGDPFACLQHAAAAVRASRTLALELSKPPSQHTHTTRYLRLAAAGVVDAKATAAMWATLPAKLCDPYLGK
jgi:hypothetical protein